MSTARPRNLLLVWESFKHVTPFRVMGDARRASSSKGENLLAIQAEQRAKVLALIGARTIYRVAAQGRFDPRQSDFYLIEL